MQVVKDLRKKEMYTDKNDVHHLLLCSAI